MLLVLAAIWGASFMFIKVGLRELDPSALVFLRVGIATLVLVPIACVTLGVRATAAALTGSARPLLLVATMNSVIPFLLLAWAEQRIDSGLAAVLQACAPLFTALLALQFVRSERVHGLRLAGLGIGFVGVALIVGVQPQGDLLAALAVVGCGLAYAIASLYAHRLADVPTVVTSVGTMGFAALLTAPLAVPRLPHHVPGWKVTGSMLALAIGGSAFAYLLYFGLIAGAGASRAILVTYLVPALALGYGVLLLGEPLSVSAVAGLALVLGGVALGTGTVRLASSK